jgi:hypothetical protein
VIDQRAGEKVVGIMLGVRSLLHLTSPLPSRSRATIAIMAWDRRERPRRPRDISSATVTERAELRNRALSERHDDVPLRELSRTGSGCITGEVLPLHRRSEMGMATGDE